MNIKPIYSCFLLYIITAIKASPCFSQNTNSPYSVYGIGDIDRKMYNRTNGMASTGLAISSSFFLVNNNPAGIAGLQRSFYVMNIAGTGKLMQYSGDPVSAGNSSSKDWWIKGISLSVKINGFWASSVGFNQFSNVNYEFTSQKQIEGTVNSYLTGYQGDGGLNEYYWTNAVSLGKHFAVGIKSSLISGSINQTESINDASLADNIITKQQDYFNHLKFEYGAIYKTALNKNWDLSLGGKLINNTKLPAARTLTVTENTTTIINDQYIKTNQFSLPQTFGGGIALTHNKKTTFAADYTFENWASLHSNGPGWQLISSNRLSAGVEFSDLVKKWNQTIEKKFFQVGAFIDNSYLQVRGHQINEYGITAGTGGNLNSLLYNLSLEAGQRGTTQAGLIKENYLQLTVSFSYRDLLFSKGKKYD